MGVFSVSYQDEGDAVIAQGGLKFRAGEAALKRYFGSILGFVALSDLIGEAVFWSLLPSTVSIWLFPLTLMSFSSLVAVAAGVGAFLAFQIFHMKFYVKPLNYLVFIFGNRPLQFLAYLVFAASFIYSGQITKSIVLGSWFCMFALGVSELLLVPIIPVISALFALPPSDQVLRKVGWYYGRKLGLNPAEWKM